MVAPKAEAPPVVTVDAFNAGAQVSVLNLKALPVPDAPAGNDAAVPSIPTQVANSVVVPQQEPRS